MACVSGRMGERQLWRLGNKAQSLVLDLLSLKSQLDSQAAGLDIRGEVQTVRIWGLNLSISSTYSYQVGLPTLKEMRRRGIMDLASELQILLRADKRRNE